MLTTTEASPVGRTSKRAVTAQIKATSLWSDLICTPQSIQWNWTKMTGGNCFHAADKWLKHLEFGLKAEHLFSSAMRRANVQMYSCYIKAFYVLLSKHIQGWKLTADVERMNAASQACFFMLSMFKVTSTNEYQCLACHPIFCTLQQISILLRNCLNWVQAAKLINPRLYLQGETKHRRMKHSCVCFTPARFSFILWHLQPLCTLLKHARAFSCVISTYYVAVSSFSMVKMSWTLIPHQCLT